MKDVIKKFLKTVCGFTAEATKMITKNQGYDDLGKFYLLDDKVVDTLCYIVRKPRTLASGSTSGHAISNLAQERLNLAIFAMKHYKHVSPEIDLERLTKKNIIVFSQQCQIELSFKNKTKGYAQATFKYLAKIFGVVIKQLEYCLGVSGILLAYVPRKNIIPRDKDDDTLENYPSLDAEAISHAPILEDHVDFPGQSATAIALLEQNRPFCNTFCIYMGTIWNILYEIFGQTPAWLHATPTKKEKEWLQFA